MSRSMEPMVASLGPICGIGLEESKNGVSQARALGAALKAGRACPFVEGTSANHARAAGRRDDFEAN